MIMKRTITLILALTAFACAVAAQDVYTDRFQNGDLIPDYSRVGYHWGDKEIPDVPVVMKIKAPKKGQDATQLIQEAINTARVPGAILLKAGTYNVSETIKIRRSGIVLRGEGESTRIVATGTKSYTLIEVGAPRAKENYDKKSETPVIEDASCGQMWLKVEKPRNFKPGDRVGIRRPATENWIRDLRMDSIPPRSDTRQWEPKDYNLEWERIVTRVDDDRIWFENPIVMGLTAEYGGGTVVKVEKDRISEVGVEGISFDSWFDAEKTDPKKGYYNDEEHGWTAIRVGFAEHGWIRRVSSHHFGYALVSLNTGCKNYSVIDCHCYEPVSIITGGRRYAFNLGGGQLNFFDGCTTDKDRHQFVTGARVCGPNVFHRCTATNSYSDCGPHHRWSTGVLYDCVKVDYRFDMEDRMNYGTGHGWAGANFILWNCEAGSFACQSPWVSAKNYAVGCIGPRHPGSRRDNHDRPQAEWESYGQHVSPESLYEYQLAQRREKGIKAVPTE